MGDETELSGVFYTEIGRPYRPGRMDRDDEMGLQFLKDHQASAPRGTAPSWTLFMTVTVDVQANRFPVQVTAWGPGGRAQIIDRFDIGTPPEDAPNVDADPQNRRPVSPGRYAEDWAVLVPLADRVWPVEGATYGLQARALCVDFQGEPGVSDNAEAFWRARRRDGQGGRWFVSRGHGGWKVPRRVWHEAPERGSKGKKARSIKILNIATDRVKDTVNAALAKAEGDAAGALYCGGWMSDDQKAELVAEARLSKGWEKKTGQARNETLDLTTMARALAEHLGVLRLTEATLPSWAEAGPGNDFAVPIEQAASEAPRPAEQPRRPAPMRMKWFDRG